jgi:Holliday junction resolvase RusA-like endonuclease
VARIQFREQQLTLPLTEAVRLVCHFHVLDSARAHDIDNLLKALIDALGAANLFGPGKYGRRTEWNRNDELIHAIKTDKFLVSSNPRTEIEIWKA